MNPTTIKYIAEIDDPLRGQHRIHHQADSPDEIKTHVRQVCATCRVPVYRIIRVETVS